ncbi:MAG: type VI secretion system baseplate subunit TssE [Rhodospirillales bacterium]|nr:type VI secretion system baseplate subunit TssE [Rhodospirillales bacterium]
MNGRGASPARPPQLSVFDRLIDREPDVVQEPALSASESFALLRTSVRADLEMLLNTRRRWRSWDPAMRELATSPVGYGLPDFASGAFNDARRREELRAEVEATIRRFETRLTQVSVTFGAPYDPLSATLRLRISALLQAEPAPEPIAFETVLDASNADVTVKAEDA